MKRFLLISLLVGAVFSLDAVYRPGYYNQMDGKKKEELKSAVKQCVQNHQTLTYSQLPGYWQYTDVYPELVDGCKRWWDMYSDELCLIRSGQNAFQSFSGYKMQREHSVPKSWWKQNGDVEYTPAYSDLWNLYPSNGAANQAKLNYSFGPCQTATFDNGVSKVGTPKNGYGGGSSRVFEPADEYKGDFARSMFYMACVYPDINWVINYMFRKESYPTLTNWAMNMLLQWAREDKVSQKEIDRNNLVEQYQGNRNPFVDFPELAEYIWGVRTNETFIIADQESTDPTPPITGDPELTNPVNGTEMDFGQAAVGHAVTRALSIEGSNFTSPLSVRVVGADRSLFHLDVSEIPASTLNAAGGYMLDITYLPQETGRHEAKLTLYDGGLEGSVAITLKGEALPVPELTALTALEATDVTANSYVANWNPADGIADYYTVTRVRYNGDNQETETYETGETSLLMTDRDPGMAETYTVTYTRLGIVSPESNTIYVGTSGVNAIEYGVPYRVFADSEGILFLTGDGNDVEGVTISDVQGNVYLRGTVSHGDVIPVPRGVYIITAPGQKPRKIIL